MSTCPFPLYHNCHCTVPPVTSSASDHHYRLPLSSTPCPISTPEVHMQFFFFGLQGVGAVWWGEGGVRVEPLTLGVLPFCLTIGSNRGRTSNLV